MQPRLCKVKKPWDVPEHKSNTFSIIWFTAVLDTVSCHQSSEAGCGTHHFVVLCCYFILFLYALKKRTWRARLWLQKLSLEYWQMMDGATHCCILLVGSLLMICLNGKSQSSILLWKHCTGFFVGSFLHLKQRRGEVRIYGCRFRVEMTILGDTSGWKAQETLVSTVYGCSCLPPPRVFN